MNNSSTTNTTSTLLKSLVIILFVLSTCLQAQSQSRLTKFLTPADSFNKKRTIILNAANVAAFSGLLGVLKFAWYQNYDRTHFHFFNDDAEWLQMDKCGHFTMNYNGALIISEMYQWAGVRQRKAILYGAGIGFAMEMVIETLDGFSSHWGFSPGDFTADVSGASLLIGQDLLWHEQRIKLKYSNSPRVYQPMQLQGRANNLFGNTTANRLINDYNSMTLWASFNIHSFIPNKNNKFPAWLNLAVGYSAENLFNGRDSLKYYPNGIYYTMQGKRNYGTPNSTDYQLTYQKNPRYRQVLLAFDIDLTKIKTKSKFLKTVFKTINIIKIPSPTLEYNTQGKFVFHPLYF